MEIADRCKRWKQIHHKNEKLYTMHWKSLKIRKNRLKTIIISKNCTFQDEYWLTSNKFLITSNGSNLNSYHNYNLPKMVTMRIITWMMMKQRWECKSSKKINNTLFIPSIWNTISKNFEFIDLRVCKTLPRFKGEWWEIEDALCQIFWNLWSFLFSFAT